jgi:hypothetical protein
MSPRSTFWDLAACCKHTEEERLTLHESIMMMMMMMMMIMIKEKLSMCSTKYYVMKAYLLLN